jgi:hypothetical protein
MEEFITVAIGNFQGFENIYFVFYDDSFPESVKEIKIEARNF